MSVHGRLLQVRDAHALSAAVDALRERGYTRLEAFTPYAVDGLMEKLGPPPRRIPRAMLAGGVLGGIALLLLQYYAAAVDYPLDVGGRPLASWPAFVPSALEVAILGAVVAGYIAFLVGCGFPALYQPVFHVAWFEEASRDGFLLLVRADDPRWDAHGTARDIAALDPMRHAEVPS
ncbi:DUF3341 domain-containing protein [Luteibacter sp. 329MFSha]|uniref:DUF3341 domain-containing protein n=1 Tax=Luteibacter sp. 329MFSha TaxID=1798239 RepID=UPI0008BB639A|nr:DUF3341 domain-containing protein [Luteibacter sp. 329MFSha]SEV84993.1 Protein of unknown function [Luteibacter sp. 329MFSha]